MRFVLYDSFLPVHVILQKQEWAAHSCWRYLLSLHLSTTDPINTHWMCSVVPMLSWNGARRETLEIFRRSLHLNIIGLVRINRTERV